MQPHCVKTTHQSARRLALQPRVDHEATQRFCQKQKTPQFKLKYGLRAGVEGTMSQGVRRCDIRHARYIGLGKTHFQQLCSAAGLNLVRLGEWLSDTPLAKTRVSPFAPLKKAA